MIHKNMVIWSDPEFLKEDGTPEEGAEIYGECFRVHPIDVKKVQSGIKQMLGLYLKIVPKKPELGNAKTEEKEKEN